MSATQEDVRKKIDQTRRGRRNRSTRNQKVQGGQGGQGAKLGDLSGTGANSNSIRTKINDIGAEARQFNPFDSTRVKSVLSKGLASDQESFSRNIIEPIANRLGQFNKSIGVNPENAAKFTGAPTSSLISQPPSIPLKENIPDPVINPSVPSESQPNTPLRLGELGTATSQRNQDGSTTFNLNDGVSSVSTSDQEGANRIANGQGIRGGTVSTIDGSAFAKANTEETVRSIISQGNRLGASPGDIQKAVDDFRRGGPDVLQEQLDRVDRLERNGSLNSAFAQGRRDRINKAILSRDTLAQNKESAAQSTAQGNSEFDRQQAVREGNLSLSQQRLQLDKTKAVANDIRASGKTVLSNLSSVRDLLDKGTSLSVLKEQLGPDALLASAPVISQLTDVAKEIRQNPEDTALQQDSLIDFNESNQLNLNIQEFQQLLTRFL